MNTSVLTSPVIRLFLTPKNMSQTQGTFAPPAYSHETYLLYLTALKETTHAQTPYI